MQIDLDPRDYRGALSNAQRGKLWEDRIVWFARGVIVFAFICYIFV